MDVLQVLNNKHMTFIDNTDFCISCGAVVSEIENEVDLVVCNSRRNLLGAAEATGEEGLYLKSRNVGNIGSGGVGSAKVVAL